MSTEKHYHATLVVSAMGGDSANEHKTISFSHLTKDEVRSVEKALIDTLQDFHVYGDNYVPSDVDEAKKTMHAHFVMKKSDKTWSGPFTLEWPNLTQAQMDELSGLIQKNLKSLDIIDKMQVR